MLQQFCFVFKKYGPYLCLVNVLNVKVMQLRGLKLINQNYNPLSLNLVSKNENRI